MIWTIAYAWGRRVRHATLAGAYDVQVAESDLTAEQWVAAIETPARLITRASWWIDNRHTGPGDVAALIAAAQTTAAVVCENDA
jgi:hypothetical protein